MLSEYFFVGFVTPTSNIAITYVLFTCIVASNAGFNLRIKKSIVFRALLLRIYCICFLFAVVTLENGLICLGIIGLLRYETNRIFLNNFKKFQQALFPNNFYQILIFLTSWKSYTGVSLSICFTHIFWISKAGLKHEL